MVRSSVVVVSRGRREALKLCLTALGLQDHEDFEVIVVADPQGIAAASGFPVKTVPFGEANISAARNAGIAQAAGEVVAFIDDDAVAEPTWLSRLTAPFADPDVAAAGGFVRGRDGISFQWKAREIDGLGRHRDLPVEATSVSLHHGQPGRATKTEGTNSAFRRPVMAGLGGFDTAYRFYHDDADLNLRLAAARKVTAIVPMAQVVHGFLESDRRRADRVPLSLADIGASSAVLWRRHAPGLDHDAARESLIREQGDRLMRLRDQKKIGPEDVERLMATLTDGLAEGVARPLGSFEPLGDPRSPFLPYPAGPRPGRIIAGRIWQSTRLTREAEAAVLADEIVTLILLSPTARRHVARFHGSGYWEQRGGLFGRSLRKGARFAWWGFRRRIAFETARISAFRPVSDESGIGVRKIRKNHD